MTTKRIIEDSMNRNVLSLKEHIGAELKARIAVQLEGAFNPLKPLTRSLSFNDFEEADGAADYAAVKKIKWPYGIEVSFDDKNKKVTFKTAKMATVAKLLDKAVDFGAISAGEALDLPAELMGAYSRK